MMNMKKYVFFLLCAGLLLIFGGSLSAFAAERPVVIYDGQTREFRFENTEGTDLFPEFKEMMPGDSTVQNIAVRVENTEGPVDVYLTPGEITENLPGIFQNVTMEVRADGSLISEGALGDTDETAEGVKLFTFESPGEKELEVTLKISKEAGNELMDAKASIDWTFTVQDYGDGNTVRIRAMDLTAYTGGNSMSGDSFPTARYFVGTPDNVDLSDLIFYIDGAAPFRIEEGDGVLIQELEEVFYHSSEEIPVTPSEDDRTAGIYTIGIKEEGHLTAVADKVTYNVEYEPGTLTVRYVSDPEGILEGQKDIAVPVRKDMAEEEVVLPKGMAVGVIPGDTMLRTNGKWVVTGLTEEDGEGQIALLCDDILSLGTDVENRIEQLTERAEDFLADSGYSLEERNYEYRYLDLINEHDGNVWVSSSKGVDVYYPYPEGTSYETADKMVFLILHYKGLHREYGFRPGEEINELIAGSRIEILDAEATPAGLKFHVPESGFSPFAVTWQPAEIASAAAKTGDSLSGLWWGAVCVSACVLLLATVFYIRKNRASRRRG